VTLAMALQVLQPADEIGFINSQAFSYLKLVFVLGAILILAYLSVRFWLPRLSGLRSSSAGPIQIAGRLPIEPRKTLYIIRTGQECFLIGTSDNDIHYLTSLNSVQAETPGTTQIGTRYDR
jgi:flagellar biosynthetic protein FliO